jgi:hypothetical protein
MNIKPSNNQLALAAGLTTKTQQLCLGLESGAADILELVTPKTKSAPRKVCLRVVNVFGFEAEVVISVGAA